MGWNRKSKDKAKKMRSSKQVFKSVRKPTAQGGQVHKSKKDYNRLEDTSLDDAYNEAQDQALNDNDLLQDILGDDDY